MALFAMHLCRVQKGLLDVWRYKHRESSMASPFHAYSAEEHPCLFDLVWYICLEWGCIQASWAVLFLSPVHWASVLCFLQHNFKWALFYPILKKTWYFYNSGCHITNLFLSWTRSLHHDAVILCLWDKPSSLYVSVCWSYLCVLFLKVCMVGGRNEGREKVFILTC